MGWALPFFGDLLTSIIGNVINSRNTQAANKYAYQGLTGWDNPNQSQGGDPRSDIAKWWDNLVGNKYEPPPKDDTPFSPYKEDSLLGWADKKADPYQDPSAWTTARGGPTINYGGTTVRASNDAKDPIIGPDGRKKTDAIDISTYFNRTGSAKDTYLEAFGGGYDFNKLTGDVGNILSGAKLNGTQNAATVGNFFDPAAVESFLKRGRWEAEQSSMARSGAANDAMISRGLASGQSLAEMADRQSLMTQMEDNARAGQMSGLEASAENMQNQVRMARAAAQAQAYGQSNDINAALAREQAGLTAQLGVQDANQIMQNAQNVAQHFTWDQNADNIAKGQAWSALNGITDASLQDFARAAGITIDEAKQAIQSIGGALSQGSAQQANLNFTLPMPGSYYMQDQAIKAQNQQSSGFGFSTPWGGFNIG